MSEFPFLRDLVPTNQTRDIDGRTCRLWLGKTLGDDLVYVFVVGLAMPMKEPLPPGLDRVLTGAEKIRLDVPIEAETAELDRIIEHEKDLEIPCPACFAMSGENCRGLAHDDGSPAPEMVCFVRRVKRLVLQKRPDLITSN